MKQRQLTDLTLEALRVGLDFAGNHLLQGDAPLDADLTAPSDLSGNEWDRAFSAVTRDAGFSDEDLEQHLGAEPIPADRATHVVMRSIIQHADPSAGVVGEEATTEEWDQALKTSRPGQVLWQLDAIDGSLPYDTVTFGYSANALAYMRGRTRDQLLMAAVANSSGYTALYSHAPGETTGDVLLGRLGGTFTPLEEPNRQDIRDESVAILSSTWKHRRHLLGLLADESYTVFTTGGAPAALGLITGRLCALAATEPQTTHDAAFLPILARLEIPIVTQDGTFLGLQDVLRYFSQVARNQTDRRAKPVPPFIAARRLEVAADLGAKLFPNGS